MTESYPTPQAVRARLKEHNVAWRYKIRRSHSPFGGSDRWNITLHDSEIPQGVSLLYAGSSNGGSTYGSTDNGQTAAKMNILKTVFGTYMPLAE